MEKEVEVVEKSEIVEIDDLVILSKPYKFEGKEYENVDLSGMKNIKAIDMIEAQKIYDRSGGFSIMPEMTMEYALVIASRASKHPIEFFYSLPPIDAIRIKNKVTSFFYGQG